MGREDPAGHHGGTVPDVVARDRGRHRSRPARGHVARWFARQRAAAPYRLWEWYQAADYRRFRDEGPDPFEPVDVTPLVRDADLLRVKPLRTRFVDRFRPEDVQRVRDAHLDVMLRFGFRIVKGEILERCTVRHVVAAPRRQPLVSRRAGAVLGDVRTQPGVGDYSPDSDGCARRREGALSIDCRHQLRVPLQEPACDVLEERRVHDAAPRRSAPRRLGLSAGSSRPTTNQIPTRAESTDGRPTARWCASC